jgi:hypothetical protein
VDTLVLVVTPVFLVGAVTPVFPDIPGLVGIVVLDYRDILAAGFLDIVDRESQGGLVIVVYLAGLVIQAFLDTQATQEFLDTQAFQDTREFLATREFLDGLVFRVVMLERSII